MYQKIKHFCFIFALVLLVCPVTFAQLKLSRYKGNVQKVDSGGVYRIELSPDLIAKSNDSLSDIRLTDSDGKNIACVLSNKLKLQNTNNFIVFPGVAQSIAADTGVYYIAENKNTLDISQLWLKLKKTAVNRTVSLSGSDDLKNWFAIEEDIPLQQAGGGSGADYLQSLVFPTSNYRYFKIQVDGKNKTPVKILQAGIYTTSLNKPVYIQLPPLKFKLGEEGKRTRIFIHSSQPYLVNKLHFDISDPKYYNRRIVIYAITGKDADDKLMDTVISSGGTQDVIITTKEKQIGVDIYNGDDSPLTIKGITQFQTKLYAVCYLDGGHDYKIYTGDPQAKPADYDLSFLNNRAYNQLPGITHMALHKNPAYVILPHPEKNDDNSMWLWTALIVGLLVLSLLTLKMVREIK
jgi:hypothetical protein